MADSKSTGVPAFLLSKPVSAVRRGDLVHVVCPVDAWRVRRAVKRAGGAL